MIRSTLAMLCLLLAVTPVSAALKSNARPEYVVPHAHLIVRGTVDLAKREVRVVKVYGGAKAPERLRVENLKSFGSPGAAFLSPEEREKLEREHPTHAILFLATIDDRFWLVDTPSPTWVPPWAAIKYVDKDGKMLGYHQMINPGPLNLVPEKHTLAEFEAALEAWLKARPEAPPRRKALTGEDRAEFWKTVTPWLDFYSRDLPAATRGDAAPAKAIAGITKFILEHDGLARARGIEALLILGQHRRGGPTTARERAVEKALFSLTEKLPREALEPVLLAELASLDVFSVKDIAGRGLVRLGEESAKKGRDLLVRMVESHEDSSIAGRAFWCLKSMGLAGAADAAMQKREGKKK